MTTLTRPRIALAVLAVSLFALTACAPESSPAPSASASSTPSASATVAPSPSPSATPSPSAQADPIAVTLTCDQLISRKAMYDFNPNFGLQAGFTPKSGTAAATAVANKGLACSWLNQTSRETIEVSVANLPPAQIASMKAELNASSTPVSTFAVPGYFNVAGGVGQAETFDGTFWVAARSAFFTEAPDAVQIVDAALGSLD